MSDKVQNKWIEYYENEATMSYTGAETPGGAVHTQIVISRKQLIEIFEIDTWLQQHLDISLNKLHRYYINVYRRGDALKGHKDFNLKDDTKFLNVIICLNPHANNNSGIEINGEFVEDKFNRMVILDGAREHHKVIAPTDDVIRITLYLGFIEIDTPTVWGQVQRGKNHWHLKDYRNGSK